jgi:hypothetical protein
VKKHQHIKNFFKFINDNDERKIPIQIKLDLFPEYLDDEEKDYILTSEKISFEKRARYINYINKTNRWDFIAPFGSFSPTTTLAISKNNNVYFINLSGEQDVTGIDKYKLFHTEYYYPAILRGGEARAAYFNALFEKNIFKYIFKMDGFFGPNVAVAILYNPNGYNKNNYGGRILINHNGIADVSQVDLYDILKRNASEKDLAAYFNTLIGRDDIWYVYKKKHTDEIGDYFDATTIYNENIRIYMSGEVIYV